MNQHCETVGIDAGTGVLKVAELDLGGGAIVCTNSNGEPSTRSVIYFSDTGPVIGQAAIHEGAINPKRLVVNWKRDLGTDTVLATDAKGTSIRARDCLKLFLQDVKTTRERVTGQVVRSVVICIPANFNQRQRAEVVEAAQSLGLEVLLLIPEPTAAALGNGVHLRGDGLTLIVDVGHGTTDASIVRVRGHDIEVVATRGIAQLGGLDFSERLKLYALDQFDAEHGLRPTAESHPVEFGELDQRIEQAKHTLSRLPEATIVVQFQGSMTLVKISQAKFNELCGDLLESIVLCVTQLLADACLTVADLRETLLVGGASHMPMLQSALVQRLGVQLSSHCEPHYAAALGAAIAGRLEMERQGRPVYVGSVRLPSINRSLREVTSHDIGVTTLTEDGQKEVLSPVLSRNSCIPCERILAFQLAEAGQTDALIQLLQGQADAERKDCQVLGEFELRDLPPIFDGPHRVDICLRIDRNGLLDARAVDSVSGKEAQLLVDYKHASAPAATTGLPAVASAVSGT